VLSAAPLYMRESLLFPYNAGARFQDAVYRDKGQSAFESVFAHAPKSTHEVMHPQDYLATKDTSPGPAPSYETLLGKRVHEYRGLIESSLGEFDHAILLRQYVGQAEAVAAASHILGSSFRLYEQKRAKYPVLAYWSEWDSPEAAQTFFNLYQKVMRGKWKKMQLESQTKTEITGLGDSGRFLLRITGRNVQLLEGQK
jgi:hypothetical protein